MFSKFNTTYLTVFLVIVFFGSIILFSDDSYAQGLYKVTDKIGGSGSSNGQSQDTGDNSTTLIIVGAAVIAGFLVYKLVLDKDKPVKDTKKDSTSSEESLIFENINNHVNNSESQFEKYQRLPVNIFAGIQKHDLIIPERKIILGISYNF